MTIQDDIKRYVELDKCASSPICSHGIDQQECYHCYDKHVYANPDMIRTIIAQQELLRECRETLELAGNILHSENVDTMFIEQALAKLEGI